ncbi:hypothetical protein PtA15_7A556 [Puccinia triticina]|uniref:Uncharacterized protein n=1 Tax=Puccinia triticina TaxID=208348 RepID=A0ABY7CQU2_9BASI|nr:uncharacterized protein PtA15_7A556 [Puccinia triticina]WAQ86827.1 hypothetical protein PtA15_7A556 [Puccinia triticina]WAR56695.1 hypothetical protein PtB15_7B545 [Puccinia triticina]
MDVFDERMRDPLRGPPARGLHQPDIPGVPPVPHKLFRPDSCGVLPDSQPEPDPRAIATRGSPQLPPPCGIVLAAADADQSARPGPASDSHTVSLKSAS